MHSNMDLLNRATFSLLLVLAGLPLLLSDCRDGMPSQKQVITSKMDKVLAFVESQPEKAIVQIDSILSENRGFTPTQKFDLMIARAQAKAVLGEAQAGLDELNNLAIQYPNIKKRARWHIEKGKMLYKQGAFDLALRSFLEAKTLTSPTMEAELAEAIFFIGKYYHTRGSFDRSEELYYESMNLATSVRDTALIVEISTSLGKHYETIGNYPEALRYSLEAVSLAEAHSNIVVLGESYNHLGSIYLALGNNEESLMWHKKALNVRSAMEHGEGIAKSEKNLGLVYENMGALEEAQRHYHRSLSISREVAYKKGEIKSLIGIGSILLKKGNRSDAELYFQKALFLSKEMGYDKGIGNSLHMLGWVALESGKLKTAEELLFQSSVVGDSTQMLALMADNFLRLAQVYEEQGDRGSALDAYKAFLKQREILLNEDKNRAITELQILFETEEKERQNEILRKEAEIANLEISRQKYLLAGLILCAVLLGLLAILAYSRFRHKSRAAQMLATFNEKMSEHNRQLERLNRHLDQSNKEKVKLFSLIGHELRNPLFWFNRLTETLSADFESMSSEKRRKALSSLRESSREAFHLTDNLLQWSRSQLHKIHTDRREMDLTQLLKDVIELFQPTLQEKQIELSVKLPEDAMGIVDENQVSTIVRNVLSNAIKFTPEFGKIDICLGRLGDRWELIIDDSGMGLTDEQIIALNQNEAEIKKGWQGEMGSGLGLKISHQFAVLNEGSLKIARSDLGGCRVILELPVAVTELV